MLLPSNFEGMPVAAMEALGAGCTVVASDTSGLEEYMDVPAATNALRIFPRGDVHRGAAAVIAAAKVAPETRRAAARKLADQEFSIETCMDRYAGLLQRLHKAPVVSGATVPAWTVADVASLSIAAARRARRWVSTQTTATTHPR
jgi:glycosyltransferase involved in cell wall biosynthesis